MTKQEALVILNAVSGLGARRIRALMNVFGSPQEVLSASKEQLAQSSLLTPLMVHQLASVDKVALLAKEQELVAAKNARIMTMDDEDYPHQLKFIAEAPVCLYMIGDSSLLNLPSIAIVGSRHAGVYGLRVANEFAMCFVDAGVAVISGLARGIDASAHQGALKEKGKTIGVIGCGLNHIYPKDNRKLYEAMYQEGLIISEYAMDTAPINYNFPWRNRIISALAQAVVVIEAAEKSGALITATYAAEQGREVFVVPANIDSPTSKGSNMLIRDGAQVALSPSEVLQSIGITGRVKEKQGLTGAGNQVNLNDDCLYALKKLSREAQHIDQILVHRRLSLSQWHSALLELQLLGLVTCLPGQYYIKL